ncbi:MAG: hypothetical protein JXR87_10645 [Candidatus Marinimicrobia bacterium]|nr:hypothetical protein [Candidatus Neomarinimicrobiota bacterium]
MKRLIACVLFGLCASHCYNNAHLRTTRALDTGERANSFSIVSAIGGPSPGGSLYSGISGLRVETSFLKGSGIGEHGLYLAAGVAGTEGTSYIIGYDKNRYISLNHDSPFKLGIQGEIGISSGRLNSVGIQLRPFLCSMTSSTTQRYYGFHSLLSYSNVEDVLGMYLPDNTVHKFSSVGVGVTLGKESAGKRHSVQRQWDVSLVRSYLREPKAQDTQIMMAFSVGLNSFNTSKKVKTPVYEPGDFIFDPETGFKLEERKPAGEIPKFDPETGQPVAPDTTEKAPEFDPETGLPVCE